jgi:hypothetical protein
LWHKKVFFYGRVVDYLFSLWKVKQHSCNMQNNVNGRVLIAISFWLWYAESLERYFGLKVTLAPGSVFGGGRTTSSSSYSSSSEKTRTEGS